MSPLGRAEIVYSARVVGRRPLSDRCFELEFGAEDGSLLPGWDPGAHIDIRLGAEMVRQYSLVPSRQRSGTWTVAVLVEPDGRGGSTRIDSTLHEGASVRLSGPRNHFPLTPADTYLFIAGGIGITPLRAMCAAAEQAGADWRLAYLGRERRSMPYLDELREEFGERVDLYVSGEGRRFDVEAEIAALPAGAQVYCCGPDRLMSAVEAAVPESDLARLHLEHFSPREDPQESENVEFVVYAASSGVEFVVPADESILMAADFEGIVVPGDCLEGTCGSCEVRVLRGEVEHRDSVLSPRARRESSSMMICVSRAKAGCERLELEL